MIRLIENNLNVITAKDAEDLALIHQEVFDHPWDKTVFDKFLKDPTFLGFKVLEQSITIGFILLRKIVDEGEIITFAVKKAFQNQGIGKILLKTVIEHVSYNSIFLEVNTKNKAALHLYQKFHFKIQSLRRSYYENGEDAYLMCFTKSCDH